MSKEKRNIGSEFEEEVKSFISEKLNFEDVMGGPGFHIAPPGKANQTDVCGRFGNYLFVFQCKASGRITKKDLREQILATRERARITIENYKRIKEYLNCNFVIFVFITKKIIIPDEHKSLLEYGNPKIWYADEHTLEYYSDLSDKIGDYATYNFLADFGVRPSKSEQLKVTALKTTFGKYNVYNFYSNPKELIKFSYVARRRSTKENYYQRMLEKSRIRNITKFIDSGGIFPTNIIISIKGGKTKFKKIDCNDISPNLEIGTLSIEDSYNACWIIDGQHRLYSFANSKSENQIACIAFDNINIEEERSFFLEINREQKPIQADLIWDLEGLAKPESERGIISNIVRTLNNRKPFLDKIYIPVKGSRIGKIINMAAFCNGIINSRITKPITPNCVGMLNPLHDNTVRTMVNRTASVLERYFSSIDEYFDEIHKQFMFCNAGVPIMLYLLEPIVANIGRIPSYRDFHDYIKAMKDFFSNNYPNIDDIRKLREETNSEFGRKSVAKQMGLFIRKIRKDYEFWPKMEETDLDIEIRVMERRIGKFIQKELLSLSSSWEKQRVPQPISEVAKMKMRSDGTPFDENLDLGDEKAIIIRKDNWNDIFKKQFINKNGFETQEELNLAFQYLSKIRNPAIHMKSFIPSKDTISQCRIYLNKFDRIIPDQSEDNEKS
jgi:DNA sulfur modification protein DndB